MFANWRNPRTQERWDEIVAESLILIKLVTALYPLLDMAFIMNYTDPTCAASLELAAQEVYAKVGWPTGVTNSTLDWLDTSTFRYRNGNQTCIYGCHPQNCEFDEYFQKTVCHTQCVADLEATMLTFFVITCVTTLVMVLIPIFLIRWEVRSEMKKAATGMYSFLQCQAKMLEVTPYEYYSWGGSHTEDFIEYAIGFSTLVCFGIMLPVTAAIGFVFSLVTFRIFAFRTLNVTCRPFPDSMDGIGCWQDIFSNICLAALLINVGLICLVVPPIRDESMMYKCVAMLVCQHFLLAIHILVGFAIPDEPSDILVLRDINTTFQSSQSDRISRKIFSDKMADYSKVNLACNDEPVRSE
jgi:hypothetical protein